MAKIKRLNDKQRSAKYYTEYKKWSRTDFTKLGGELRKGKQFLLHIWTFGSVASLLAAILSRKSQ
jgi:hypothetical protein